MTSTFIDFDDLDLSPEDQLDRIARNLTHDNISTERRCISTRVNYQNQIRRMVAFVKDEHPLDYEEYFRDDLLIKPMSANLLRKLLMKFHVKKSDNGKLTFKSSSAFNSFGSAIRYFHEISDENKPEGHPSIILSQECIDVASVMCKGRKRIMASLKAKGLLNAIEGKTFLRKSGYVMLARKALIEPGCVRTSLLAHAFMVIDWNLMSRSQEVGSLRWENIGWECDSLTVTSCKSKTNQSGEHITPRFLYANPIEPVICPILALGIKLVCTNTCGNIFEGVSAESKFSNWLQNKMANLNLEEIARLGCRPKDIGTHSFRKGASTFACGVTDGPQYEIVNLRMEHTNGGVKDRYIFRQAGADKFVGRTVCGLDLTSSDFAILPPHFIDLNDVDFAQILPVDALSVENPGFLSAIPFLIASVIYHWDWIKATLPPRHSIFYSKIVTLGLVSAWKSKVSIVSDYQADIRPTGIPMVIAIAKSVDRLSNVTMEKFEAVFEVIEELPERIRDSVMECIGSANGVIVHQENAIRNAVKEIVAPLAESLAESVLRIEKRIDSITSHDGITQFHSIEGSAYEPITNFKSFCWGGRIHNFPENFVMPGENCSAVWILWLFGNSEESIAPYRSLYTKYMHPNERAQHSKAKYVMDTVLEESGQTYDEITAKGPHEALKIFEENYSKLLGQKRNFRTLHFSTVYKHLKKSKNT